MVLPVGDVAALALALLLGVALGLIGQRPGIRVEETEKIVAGAVVAETNCSEKIPTVAAVGSEAPWWCAQVETYPSAALQTKAAQPLEVEPKCCGTALGHGALARTVHRQGRLERESDEGKSHWQCSDAAALSDCPTLFVATAAAAAAAAAIVAVDHPSQSAAAAADQMQIDGHHCDGRSCTT
jgi:hypothetical protein